MWGWHFLLTLAWQWKFVREEKISFTLYSKGAGEKVLAVTDLFQ